MKLKKLLAQRIRELRETSGMSQEEIAERGELSLAQVEKLEQGKKRAPTRPHPHTPPKPGVLKAAGPAVAAADRLRDKIAGRGR